MALRPTFSMDLPCASRTAIERMGAYLAARPLVLKRSRTPGGGVERTVRDEVHLVLTMPPEFIELDDWRPATDGRGYSLTIVDAQGPPASWTNSASWTASSVVDGTTTRPAPSRPCAASSSRAPRVARGR